MRKFVGNFLCRRLSFIFIRFAAYLALFLFIPIAIATADDNVTVCDAVEIDGIHTGVPYPSPVDQENIIKQTDPLQKHKARTLPAKSVIIFLGPEFGSMDSRNLDISIECNPDGFTLLTAITRSSEYHNTAAKNLIWRPSIRLDIRQNIADLKVRAEWLLRLRDGKILDKSDNVRDIHSEIVP